MKVQNQLCKVFEIIMKHKYPLANLGKSESGLYSCAHTQKTFTLFVEDHRKIWNDTLKGVESAPIRIRYDE